MARDNGPIGYQYHATMGGPSYYTQEEADRLVREHDKVIAMRKMAVECLVILRIVPSEP